MRGAVAALAGRLVLMEDTYTHGHQESVLQSHRRRTAENSAGYLLPHLRAGMDLLDVGCGPGTVTVDLAERVSPGRVVGLDRSDEVVAEARRTGGSSREAEVRFATGDAYGLEFEDHCFDVVHAHQVLQHLAYPTAALSEMRRVLRPGGILAVRDADYGAFVWSPGEARIERWREVYRQVCARNGADCCAGRRLPAWVRAAGFRDLRVSSSTWTFADAERRSWWAGTWAARTVGSSFADQAVEYGIAGHRELESIADGWRRWAASEEGVFVVVHVEVLATT